MISLFPPLLLKTGIGGKRDITLCPGWQVLLENSVSDRKFYNVEMLEFLKRERETEREKEERLFDDGPTP